jgi:hypothetical protein
MFEGNYVDCSFVIGTKRLYAGGYYNVNPRLQHSLQIAHCDSLVDRGQKKAEASSTLGYDLAPSFSERSLDGENDGVGRVPAEMLDGGEDEIRLSVDDGLRCELSPSHPNRALFTAVAAI